MLPTRTDACPAGHALKRASVPPPAQPHPPGLLPSLLLSLPNSYPTTSVQTLAAYNILSAPVSDATSGEYVGMVDVADIMAGVVRGEQTFIKFF